MKKMADVVSEETGFIFELILFENSGSYGSEKTAKLKHNRYKNNRRL